jgi:GDP-L-fucose synthase
MKVLVAGDSGLAGSAILETFALKGHDVHGINSKTLNLLDRQATFDFVRKLSPDLIIDAAAKVGGIQANKNSPVDFLLTNLEIQNNLINAAHTARVKKFVFLLSSCVYPRNCPQPIREEYLHTGILEETNSAYAMAKLSGLELIKSYRSQYGYAWISLMPTNLYGPNDNFNLNDSHVVPALIRKFSEACAQGTKVITFWGSGGPLREFMSSKDLAAAVMIAVEKYNSAEHINVGTGNEISIKDLAEMVAQKVGFKGKIEWDLSKPDGTPRKILDSSKIRALGWKPSEDLKSGISKTVDWYQNAIRTTGARL